MGLCMSLKLFTSLIRNSCLFWEMVALFLMRACSHYHIRSVQNHLRCTEVKHLRLSCLLGVERRFMSGSWPHCRVLSQNPHLLPKLISDKCTNVLSNPLQSSTMATECLREGKKGKYIFISRRATHFSFVYLIKM